MTGQNHDCRVYRCIGVMSGTSLDGLDMAACEFRNTSGKWDYSIRAAETLIYDDRRRQKLATAHALDGLALSQLNCDYGFYIAEALNGFIEQHQLNRSEYFVASHGHTIFHQPESFLTLQIGSGWHIAAATGMAVVCDFRTADVAMGGQGAPLVPAGDALLFSGFPACLNIGGFANCSFQRNAERIAFDICPANIVLNALMLETGKNCDFDGELGRSGRVDAALLHRLNSLPFYGEAPPRSLGREWVEKNIMPLLNESSLSLPEKLATYYQHIAVQIHSQLAGFSPVLTTGGGAHNRFLIESLNRLQPDAWLVPDTLLTDFKEAVIFAFLGLLRILGQDNVLASVTGAPRNHCSGSIFGKLPEGLMHY